MVLIPPAEEGNVKLWSKCGQIPREQEGNGQSTMQVLSDNMLLFDPEQSSLLGFQIHESVPQKKGKNTKFIFDWVFGEMTTQAEVFENTTKEILNGVLSGHICSVFSYGATGAGKTYSMLGSEKEPGIMYLTMKELYKKIEIKKKEKLCEVFMSYQEVYNEHIYDLLEPKGPLAIREDPEKGILVQGLSVQKPKSAVQVLEMLKQGNLKCMQHPTDMNATSSRSHAIFQIKPNVVRLNQSNSKYAAIYEQLKIEVADLRGRLRAYEENMPQLKFFPALVPSTSEQMEIFRSEEITLDNGVLQKDDSTEMGPSQLLKQNCSRKSHMKEDSGRKFEGCCPKFSNPIKHQEKVESQLQGMDKEQLKRD